MYGAGRISWAAAPTQVKLLKAFKLVDKHQEVQA